jgi:hypothetical protein
VGKLLFLLPVLLSAQTPETRVRPVDPGWKIISTWMPGHREAVTAVSLEQPTPHLTTSSSSLPPAPESRVLTVCEALSDLNRYNLGTIVIVGIFKSGMDETLRQDCPRQLVTAEVSWPNAIGLTHAASPPDALRDQIEKKRVELIAAYSPEAKPRPERVVGLYGRLASPSGLTGVACCRGSVETNIPPARLFGLAEQDLRVIR